MFPILQVGLFAIQVPGLILLAGLLVGVNLSERFVQMRGKRFVVPDDVSKLTFIGLITAFLGARLGYVLRFPAAFGQNLPSLFSLNPDLLNPWAGMVAGLIACVIYAQRKGLTLWPTLDAFTPLFTIMNIALPLSNLASGAAYGLPTDMPWAIRLFGAQRHPTQIYEALAAGIMLWFLWTRHTASTRPGNGQFFLEFLTLGAGTSLFLHGFRANDPMFYNGWRLTQVAAWLILALSLWLLRRKDQVRRHAGAR
jgi:phosphatidylglycerol:prolipoprotein diacylglycerol transferase